MMALSDTQAAAAAVAIVDALGLAEVAQEEPAARGPHLWRPPRLLASLRRLPFFREAEGAA